VIIFMVLCGVSRSINIKLYFIIELIQKDMHRLL
jgi:hypothetical protein